MSEKDKNIILKRAACIINSAADILSDGVNKRTFTVKDLIPLKKIEFNCFITEFCIDSSYDAKIFFTTSKSAVQNLSLALFGTPIVDSDGEEMVQDGINELLNMIIGNAAKKLEELGLNFAETLIPLKGNFTDERQTFSNFLAEISSEVGKLSFIISFSNSINKSPELTNG